MGFGLGMLIGGLLANKTAHRGTDFSLKLGVAAIALAIPIALGSLFAPSVLGSIALVGLGRL